MKKRLKLTGEELDIITDIIAEGIRYRVNEGLKGKVYKNIKELIIRAEAEGGCRITINWEFTVNMDDVFKAVEMLRREKNE